MDDDIVYSLKISRKRGFYKDIIGYTRSIPDADGKESVKMFMRGTSRFEAGSRFKYTPDSIDLSYNNLVKAIGDAIDKQMEEDGKEFFTDDAVNLYKDTTSELNFDKLIDEFNTIIVNIPGSADPTGETEDGREFAKNWAPRITEIIERYAGKGVKVSTLNRGQVEQLSLIVQDLNDLVKA